MNAVGLMFEDYALLAYSLTLILGAIFNIYLIHDYAVESIEPNTVFLHLLIADLFVSGFTCSSKIHRHLFKTSFLNTQPYTEFAYVIENVPIASATINAMVNAMFSNSKPGTNGERIFTSKLTPVITWMFSFIVVAVDRFAQSYNVLYFRLITKTVRTTTCCYAPLMSIIICNFIRHSDVMDGGKFNADVRTYMHKRPEDGTERPAAGGEAHQKFVIMTFPRESRKLQNERYVCFYIIAALLYAFCWCILPILETIQIVRPEWNSEYFHDFVESFGIMHSLFGPMLYIMMDWFNWTMVCPSCLFSRANVRKEQGKNKDRVTANNVTNKEAEMAGTYNKSK